MGTLVTEEPGPGPSRLIRAAPAPSHRGDEALPEPKRPWRREEGVLERL